MIRDGLSLVRRTGLLMITGLLALIGYRRLSVPAWPAWMGASIILAAAGAAAGLWAFHRVRARRRAHRLPIEDASVAPRKGAKESIQALRSQWNDAIRFLKRSRLKKTGHPLYALPWYLVVGAPGSGKTTALRQARLTSFAESPGSTEIAPTDHVEWSFFEQAVVIDTAGRYTVPQSSEENEEEWHVLLDLLLKSRPREPFNGLAIVLSADQLAAGTPESLETLGKTLRKRINELLTLVGYKFPIYLLVSKCDLVPGMAPFCKRFSQEGLRQAMGCLNDKRSSDAAAFLDEAFATLSARLKSLRLILTGQSQGGLIDPALLLFPEKFAGLRGALASLLREAFGENRYHETPLLRGLFFAGSPGCFLHEFFSKILPADRSAFAPTRRALSWRRGTMSLLAASWLASCCAVAGLMSYAFLQNMKMLSVLREAKQDYAGAAGASNDVAMSLVSMERFAQALLALDEKHAGAPFFDFGLRDVFGTETAFKRMLSGQFRLEILGPLDDQNQAAMAALSASSPDERFSRYVAHLVDRLGVLRERLNGAEHPSVRKTLPSFPYFQIAGHEADSDLKEKAARLYVDTAFWMSNFPALRQERTALQAQLKRLLHLKGRDPQWLIAWAAMQQSTPLVRLSDEWNGHPLGAREASVPGLFSRAGKSLMDAFFKEVEAALNDPAISGDLKYRFEHWYHECAFDGWHQFVIAFPHGTETLGSQEHWRSAAGAMSTEDGPYARLRKHLLQEFASVAESDLPPWAKHVRQIQSLERTPAYWKYQQALDKLAKAVSDPSQVMPSVAQAFDRSASPGASLFAVAFDALSKLNAGAPKELSADAAVWKLISGPLDFLWEDALRETSEKLQADWQTNVLAQATGLDAAQGLPVLLSKDGPAMRFVKEQAAPFVEWRPAAGFRPKDAYGRSIPFNAAFFSFLNGAVWMSSVTNLQVMVTASTPETNPGAQRIPHVMRLTLHCAGKNQVLVSRRLRVLESTFDSAEKSFTWTPACSETVLEMDLAGNHLVKSYPGAYGFFAFLHDFQSGKHAFIRSEFPDQRKALENLKVTTISAHYRLKGAPDYAAPKAAPATIVRN